MALKGKLGYLKVTCVPMIYIIASALFVTFISWGLFMPPNHPVYTCEKELNLGRLSKGILA